MAEIRNDFFIHQKLFAALVLNQNFVPISFFCLEAITPTFSFSLFLSVPPFRRGWSANWTSGAVMCLTIQPPPSRLRAHRHTNARAHTRSPPRKMQNCEHTVMVKGRREGEMDRGMEKGRERKEFDWTLGGNDEAILFTLPGANTCTHVLVPSYTALGLNVASSQTVSGGWLIEGIRVCCGVELAYNRAVCIECCSTFTLMTSAKSLLSDIKNRMIVLKETTTQTNNSTQ